MHGNEFLENFLGQVFFFFPAKAYLGRGHYGRKKRREEKIVGEDFFTGASNISPK